MEAEGSREGLGELLTIDADDPVFDAADDIAGIPCAFDAALDDGVGVGGHGWKPVFWEGHEELEAEVSGEGETVVDAVAGEFGEGFVHDDEAEVRGRLALGLVVDATEGGEGGDEEGGLVFATGLFFGDAVEVGGGGVAAGVLGHHAPAVVVAVVEGALVAGFGWVVGGFDGGHEFGLGGFEFGASGGVEEVHAVTGGEAFFDERPDGGVGAVGGAADLIAPAADLAVHGAVEFAFGAFGVFEFFPDFVEDLVLETFFPFAAGLFGFVAEAREFLFSEFAFAAIVGGVVRVCGVEGGGGFRVEGSELETCVVAAAEEVGGVGFAASGEIGGDVGALTPRGVLGASGGETLIDIGGGGDGEAGAAGFAGDGEGAFGFLA